MNRKPKEEIKTEVPQTTRTAAKCRARNYFFTRISPKLVSK